MKTITFLSFLLIIFVQDAYSKTIHDYFYKLDSDLNKAKYISNEEVFVVGSNGYVIYSSNQGKDWQRKLTYTDEILSYVEYVPAINTLYVIGGNGTILKSTNKGNDWDKIKLNTDAFLYSISFSNNYGVITADSGTVFTSKDYGATWNMEPKFADSCMLMRSIIVNDEIFLADEYSFIYSKKIGEKDWKIITEESDLINKDYSVKFLHYQNRLYLLTSSHLLYKSDDKSEWKIRNLDTAGAINLYVFKEDSLSIIFRDLGTPNNNFFSALNLNINNLDDDLIPWQPDFGFNFYHISIPYCTDIIANDNNEGLLAIGTQATIWKFDDAKNQWYMISHQNNSNGGFCKAYFFNDSVGVIGKYHRIVEKTNNFGTTFIPQERDVPNWDNIVDWYFINENEFYLFNNQFNEPAYPVFHTTDGGKLFENLDIKISFKPFNFDVNNDNVFAVCGVINQTAFQRSAFSVYKDFKDKALYFEEDSCVFRAIHFFSKNSFLYSASKILDAYFDSTKFVTRVVKECQIRKTKDFGQSWKIINVEKINSEISHLYFIDDQNGFLFGRYYNKDDNFYSCLMRTTDGGETWETKIDSISYYFSDIKINKTTGLGYLLSGSGLLWQTKDFGTSWELLIDEEIDLMSEHLNKIENVGNEFYITSNMNMYRAYPGIFPNNSMSITEKTESAPPFFVKPPYPNPTKDEINIKMLWSKQINFENIRFELYDVLGHKIESFPDYGLNFELENLATVSLKTQKKLAGLYYLKISLDDFNKTYPVVLN